MISIIDVANAAGVSIATVSRVINMPQKVRPETRERVQNIISKMDYQPNALARGLIRRNTKTIGILIPDINNLFYPAVVRGIEDVLEGSSYSVLLCNTDKSIEKEKAYIKILLEKRVDGFIFVGTRPINRAENEHIRKLGARLPVVLVNDEIVGAPLYTVLTDEVEGAYKAVEHLIGLGHTKIAYATGEIDEYTTYQKKFSGYKLALSQHGIKLRSEYIASDLPYPSGGYRIAQKLMALENRPTAIFAASDQIAMGVMKAAYSEGLRIPDELSLVGYANVPISEDLFPELTTVDQYPYKTGSIVAEMMTGILEGSEPQQKKIILQPELLIRQSCREI